MTHSIFPNLQPLRERPIPAQHAVRERQSGYRAHPIAMDGAASREPLMPAEAFGLAGANYYHLTRNPPYYARIPGSVPYVAVREGVGRRLAAVQRRLAADGVALWLYDGWRPNAVQAYFYDRWIPDQAALRYGTEEGLRAMRGYWSRPTTDPLSPAPHLTGGAIDLTLCWADSREPLWMGSLFDDVTPVAHLDHFEAPIAGISYSDEEARANRRLLYWAMAEQGFLANPTEWWHFSFGDQMWAKVTGEPAALYGPAEGL
ncbi:M15 family metallopeptidase [Sphingomonas canadensis]|uniref:D-alanyl-D-alanine dipeptidase n=1 Tax=Sphingomonas canadensis TaxID=1219257 RepID=A0ABW3HEK0_9SPHN|nr:M15 family metallopeptidase [Sphingomonas canadensis]MCW3837376.1 hypothetical protein [Sphingomonas canadensis]